jgi:hypothetical protein
MTFRRIFFTVKRCRPQSSSDPFYGQYQAFASDQLERRSQFLRKFAAGMGKCIRDSIPRK